MIVVLIVVFWRIGTAEPTFEKVAASHMNLSKPADGQLLRGIEVRRSDWSVTATWDIRTNMTWGAYKDWLNEQLGQRFKRIAANDTEVRFRQVSPNEVYELQAEKGEDRGPLLIHIRFTASVW